MYYAFISIVKFVKIREFFSVKTKMCDTIGKLSYYLPEVVVKLS